MPRTSTEDWTEPETLWEPVDETPSYPQRHELVRRKSITAARFMVAKSAARWEAIYTLQRRTWKWSYWKWHSTYHGKIRRISIQEQFTQLAETWTQETGHQSNMTKRAMHPAYQRIIGLGPAVVPYILERFRQGALEHWFWALSAITGDNPITEDIAGNIKKMAEAWVQWGKAHGYLTDSTQHLRPSSQTSKVERTP